MRPVSEHPFRGRLTVEKHVLENGLSVLLLPDRSAPVVSYQTWYRVGSRHERPGKTGLAHLFEHLMFNQTAHLQAGEFDRLMEAAGGDTNAATWVDWTYYRDNLPARKLELAVRLEADRMEHLTLTERQLESEREVVANERRFRVEDDVDGFLAEELFKRAFTEHPYRWPTIGWMDDILAFTTDDCLSFYRTYYAPNNATVVVVGDVDRDETLGLVEQYYRKIPRSEVPAPASISEPRQGEQRRQAFAKPVAADRALLGYKAPPETDPDWLPLHFLQEVLVGGPSSRLHRRLVVETEAAAMVHGMLSPFREPGLVEFAVAMKRDRRFAEAEAILDEEIARLRTDPVGDAEIEKVRSRIETSFYSELETAEGKAEALGHYETTVGDYRGLFETMKRVPTIGATDLRRAAERYLVEQAKTLVVAEPSGEDDEEDTHDEEA